MELITRDLAREAERKVGAGAPVVTAAPVRKEVSEAVAVGIAAGNINFSSGGKMRGDFTDTLVCCMYVVHVMCE